MGPACQLLYPLDVWCKRFCGFTIPQIPLVLLHAARLTITVLCFLNLFAYTLLYIVFCLICWRVRFSLQSSRPLSLSLRVRNATRWMDQHLIIHSRHAILV